MSDHIVHLHLPEDVYREIKRLAEEDDRTLQYIIRKILVNKINDDKEYINTAEEYYKKNFGG